MTGRTSTGPRRWLPYAIAAASGFLLAFLAVAAMLFPTSDSPVTIRIPSVVGLPVSDAERRLVAAGLRSSLGTLRPGSDAPPNTVVAQVPAAGETVGLGSEVVLEVSEGVERSSIPALIGMSRDDADRALRAVGLQLGDVTEQPSDSARGTVLSIAPAAGFLVPRGTRVTAAISAGPMELSLPDVIGREAGSARSLLEQLGFQLKDFEYDSLSTLPSGTVIAQSPAAGAAVTGGSPVTLRIAGRP